MKDWKGERGNGRYEQGHVNRARDVGKVSPMKRGPMQRVGKTSTTLENGASSTSSKIGNGFKPTPRNSK